MELPGLERVPGPLREPLRYYATRVREHGGDHVKSLTLYGAVASPTFDPSVHTVSNVLIVDSVALEPLRRLAAEGAKFGRNYISAPLVLTPDFLKASRDTFPLELIEIQERHIVLFGEAPFAALEFDPAHVRLQCERELRVLSLAMRQAVVVDGSNETTLRKAVFPALHGTLRVMRGLLWLKGKREPLPGTGVLVEVENLAGRHMAGIRRALEAPSAVDWLVFEQVYSDVAALESIADGW